MMYTIEIKKRIKKEDPIVASFKEIRTFRKLQRKKNKKKRESTYNNKQNRYINYVSRERKQSSSQPKVYQDPLNQLQCFIEYNAIIADRKQSKKDAIIAERLIHNKVTNPDGLNCKQRYRRRKKSERKLKKLNKQV